MSEPSASPPARWVGIALLSVYLIWSSTYYALRMVVREAPPFLTGGTRYLLAGVILLLVARARGLRLPTRKQWRNTALVGTLLFLMGNGFVAFASRELGSGILAIVCAGMPLIGALLSPLIGLRPSVREGVGLLVGFSAVAVLASGGDLSASPLSVGLLLLAPVGWAIGSLLVRRLDVGAPILASGAQMITGGISMLTLSLVVGEPVPALASISGEAWLWFVHLVVFGSLVGFLAYQYLLMNARPAVAMSYAYVNPVLAVILGATVGGEHVSPNALIALALICAAVFLIVTKPKPVAAATVPTASELERAS